MKKHFVIFMLVAWFSNGLVFGQNILRGSVKDEGGVPIPNATILIDGTDKGVFTNLKGEFVFEDLPSEDITLYLTHVSFSSLSRNLSLPTSSQVDFIMQSASYYIDQVVVNATRADRETPTTYSTMSNEEIEKNNFGQDIPVLLELTPSMVSTSDAGAGVGYTGMRIRGSDMTRINVTINGVPLNDSESHGVFWVNTPDLASSTESIQIQRGVGTSTLGAGAFGATINLLTDQFEEKAYAEVNSGIGSFKTFKNTVRFGTGLLNNTWSFDGRLSTISSEGYIDRAQADLKSYFFSALYKRNKTILRFLTFGGLEETYQAWWGTPESRLEGNVEEMNEVAANNGYTVEQQNNLLSSGRTFNYYLYDNEIDHYQQDHYQFHISQTLSDFTTLSGALHYTYGRGYFEQYRVSDDFEDYDIDPILTTNGIIEESDLIRRRWLDNNFYGITYSLNHQRANKELILGGGYNNYDGDHFGEVLWAQYSPNIPIRHRYYDNNAEKSDFNIFAKGIVGVSEALNIYADLQFRSLNYVAKGPDSDRVGGVPTVINIDEKFSFFNPKIGFTYIPDPFRKIYASFSIANREPVRSDFIDNQNGTIPKPETLRNLEAGISQTYENLAYKFNLYYMNYRDQLVLTGAVNDVGSAIRTNVDRSYRLGAELSVSSSINDWLGWNANASISKNKISEFGEIIYDYGINWDEYNAVEKSYKDIDIAFSPSFVGSSEILFFPKSKLEVGFISKFVSRQFLDNTADINRSIDPYFVNSLRASLNVNVKGLESLRIGLLVNNLLNHEFESNGYTFGYMGGGSEIRENYYYPQAGTNLILSVGIKF